ncbi:MAG: nucleoside-diphosphate sugar epimerase/dehydratase [Paludibacter sp.]|nr:nucleoside-diphosphate sugar epimerase/dehydratase [Paludibacter sp.]MDD4198568.1 nucleoside-diphosphate sugar epimerase/dehydratase [Paludibacter sp.]MDD4428446.1 nucleoside-diphosphate sugar epimerase/dehydratase [Paludibacter sp.]
MKKNDFGLFDTTFFPKFVAMKYLPRWIVLLMDVLLSIIAFVIAIYVADKMKLEQSSSVLISDILRTVVLMTLQIVLFWFFHTYSGVLRYASFVDAIKLFFSVVINIAIIMLINLVLTSFSKGILIFYSELIIYGVLSFLFLLLIRLLVKTSYDYFTQRGDYITPVMIYGTKSAAIGIAKMLMSEQVGSKYKLVGFIDDDKNASEKMIMGVKVYHLNDEILKKIIVKKCKSIIISPVKLNQVNSSNILEKFINNNLTILSLPPMNIWKNDIPNIGEIRSIPIENLLERPQINISTDNIASQLKDKVVLVTGAAGSIGSEIALQVLKFDTKLVVLLDHAESQMHELKLDLEEKYEDKNVTVFLGDVRHKDRMEYMMDLYRPDVIYHAAAYKHVPMMEDYPVESVQVNVLGTKILADLAVKYRVERFVMVSTDKAVNPTNVMGASKRIAEIYVQSLYRKLSTSMNGSTTKFITTRFGNVLGSNGSVIPYFKKQIEHGGPVTVTHPEIIRYFMTIPEACMLVLEAGSMGNGGEIYIFDMGKPVKIVDLARKMIRLAGFVPEEDIKIVYTGLRPGEKLFEELLNKKEHTQNTHHPKIMIANVQLYDYDKVSVLIDKLINYSKLCKDYLTVATMKKIVPEFKSKNSQYERLDI